MIAPRHAAALVVVAAVGCHGGARSRPPAGSDGAVATGLVRCTGRPFAAPPAAGWAHVKSRIAAALGEPRHVAQDVIAAPGRPLAVRARLAYGAIRKDLEGEEVLAFVDDCAGWVAAGGARTDDEGRLALTVDLPLAAGVHEVRLVVRGDGSEAAATAWVLPAGTHVVVTDLDGTMTTDDGQLFQQILDGDHVPVAYAGAAALTRAHADRGAVVVYLTGRPSWLLAVTRAWLRDLHFAPGPVHVADSNGDILPTEASVGAYKRAWLVDLQAAGYVVDAAYGNAPTDVFAYLGAGVDPARVLIIGAHGGDGGTRAVTGGWEARVGEVTASAPVRQPF